jgi:hypothetical protein
MTDVRVLELAGDGDTPHLALRQDRLEALAGVAAEPGPLFRLLELCAPGERGSIAWPAIVSLKTRAQRLLGRQDLRHRLLAGELVRLEVTGPPRELPAVWDALRAQARLQRTMFVLEVDPDRVRPENMNRVLEAWDRVLDDGPVAAPRVRRAPPAQPDAAAAAAAAVMADLLGDDARFMDSAAVGRLLSGNPELANPKMVTTRARREHRIFGAWDGNGFRYPAFQFGVDGQPRPALPDLLEVLPRDEDGTVGRDAALWLFAPDAALGDRTPAEVFVDDPARVIALTRTRRDGDDAVD